MTKLEEQYVFWVQCSDDLNEAWRLVRELQSSGRTALTEPAFKYLLIAYSRPFKASRGTERKEYRLEAEIVPARHRDLHLRLVAARDQVLAHSDLTVRDARIHVQQHELGSYPLIVQNTPQVMNDFGSLSEINELIEGVLETLYGWLRKIEAELGLATEEYSRDAV